MANGVTNEQRYALTARGRDTAEAGLIRKRDGTSWVVQPDGSEQQLPGGGGSSGVVELHRVNGIVKNFEPDAPIESVTALLFDPSAQPWLANHDYLCASNFTNLVGAVVTPTTNPNGVKFIGYEVALGMTGAVEPEWSEDGSTPVNDGVGTPDPPDPDGQPQGSSAGMEWTPNAVWAGAWQATHAFTTGWAIIANGFAWTAAGDGNTGGSEPDWPDAPDLNDTVSDGAETWTCQGPAAVWAPLTGYAFKANSDPTTGYAQFNVIPTDAVAGTSYVFLGQPYGIFGASGNTEPEWDGAMSGDGSAWIDGDILWVESTADEILALTGIVAPTAEAVITIGIMIPSGASSNVRLEDQAETVNDYGPVAESADGNGFDNDDSSWVFGTSAQGNPVAYANGAWSVLAAGAPA